MTSYDIRYVFGESPLYVRMAEAWIMGEREKVFQTLIEWQQTQAILYAVLIYKVLLDFETQTRERVNEQAKTLAEVALLLWRDSVDLDAALINPERWEKIDIAIGTLVYSENDHAFEAYTQLDQRAKLDHLKHLHDIGRFHDLIERNSPRFCASFEDYLADKFGLNPISN